jgi:hypothetical protein
MQIRHYVYEATGSGKPKNVGRVGGFGRNDFDRCPVDPGCQNVGKACCDGNVGISRDQSLFKRAFVRDVNDLNHKALLLEEALLQTELGKRSIPFAALWHGDFHDLRGSNSADSTEQ